MKYAILINSIVSVVIHALCYSQNNKNNNIVFMCSFVSFRFTFLDSRVNGGRPVLTLKAKNIVGEHDAQVVVSYAFQQSRMLVEPLILVSSFFAFFIVCSMLARLDTSLVGAKTIWDRGDIGSTDKSK